MVSERGDRDHSTPGAQKCRVDILPLQSLVIPAHATYSSGLWVCALCKAGLNEKEPAGLCGGVCVCVLGES